MDNFKYTQSWCMEDCDGGDQRGCIEGEENGPQGKTLRDTAAEFDRIGLGIVNTVWNLSYRQDLNQARACSAIAWECVRETGVWLAALWALTTWGAINNLL